jgi:outer membrane protein assembly factor BamB
MLLIHSLVACQTTSGEPAPSQQKVEQCPAPYLPRASVLTASAKTSHVLYFSNNSRLYALNAGNGIFHWCIQLTPLPGDAALGYTIFSNLTLNNGHLYTNGINGYTYSFDGATGSLLWSSNTDTSQSGVSPVVVNKVVYSGSEVLYALNAQTGHVLWKYPMEGYQAGTEPVPNATSREPFVDNGIIYFASSTTDAQGKSVFYLHALDATNGTKRWVVPLQEYGNDPLAADGMVFFTQNQTVTAVDARDGRKVAWQNGENASLVAEANGLLYAVENDSTTQSGKILALNMLDGSIHWSIPQPDATNRLRFLATNNLLYITCAQGVYAFNTTDGSLLWHKQVESTGPLMTKPALLNGELYIGSLSDDGGFLLHALNAQTGHEDWYAEAPQSALFGTEQDIAV